MPRPSLHFIATSLSGYMAAPSSNLPSLSIIEHENEDYGYSEFFKEVNTVVLGRKTYDCVSKRASGSVRQQESLSGHQHTTG